MAGSERIYKFAKARLAKDWEGYESKLGESLHRALLAEQVLRILASQDEEVSDRRVRELLIESYDRLMDEFLELVS
jgi:hypothetical protein